MGPDTMILVFWMLCFKPTFSLSSFTFIKRLFAAAAAKSLQSFPTLCNPIDGSSPGSPVPGILQARTLEWVAISFSNAGKWTVKVSCSVASDSSRPHGLQPTRLLCPWDVPGKSTRVGCHCVLQVCHEDDLTRADQVIPIWLVQDCISGELNL